MQRSFSFQLKESVDDQKNDSKITISNKILVITKHIVNKAELKIGPNSFEQTDEFIHLEVNTKTNNNMHI